MKTFTYIFLALMLLLNSCRQNPKQKDLSSNSTAKQAKETEDAIGKNGFQLDQIKISIKEIGTFPYLDAPTGYKYVNQVDRKLEEKYFFHTDSLVMPVSGRYFHATIFSEGDNFEDTYIVTEYQKAIEKMDGVTIYSGNIPPLAATLIDEQKPNYVSDMYDPKPYKYKQFIIRTATENIWIELCHGLNANQIDLTVISAANEDKIRH